MILITTINIITWRAYEQPLSLLCLSRVPFFQPDFGVSCIGRDATDLGRFPRLYRRGPKLITVFDRPASQDLALTPVFTDGELPLD